MGGWVGQGKRGGGGGGGGGGRWGGGGGGGGGDKSLNLREAFFSPGGCSESKVRYGVPQGTVPAPLPLLQYNVNIDHCDHLHKARISSDSSLNA